MKFDISEIKEYIMSNPEMKIIIGGDSQRISRKGKHKTKHKEARFVTAVICYTRDKNRIFYEVSKERDIDPKPGKPYLRMMQETYKISEITTKLMDVLIDRDFQIHLDIASDSKWGSHCALSSAVGYVWGVIGVEPVVKPHSWAASTVADHIVKNNRDVLNFH
ncbi:MAG: hypothetical protein J7L15_01425 [Clostridiales bacterium]|nr:hypothetical protein [Clostridiales bacterium]